MFRCTYQTKNRLSFSSEKKTIITNRPESDSEWSDISDDVDRDVISVDPASLQEKIERAQ